MTNKYIISILLCVMIVISVSSCSMMNKDTMDHLVYYTLNDKDDLSWIIEKYNKHCKGKYDKSYQIEIVKFDSENELSAQLSTEIMAGSGPDIISLSQKLPFEKFIESGSLVNIYDLQVVGEAEKRIDFRRYNDNVLDAGTYEGGLYIVPLFYGVDVLVSTEERLNALNMNYNNGFTLTYSNLSNSMESFFDGNGNYSFVPNDAEDFLWFDYPKQLFCRFINSYVDFYNKTTYFNTKEFKDNLETMKQMMDISKTNTSQELFDGLYMNRSFPLMTGNYSYYKSNGETPIVFKGIVRDEKVISAHIQVGIAVNNNTKLKEQALAFIEFALSDEVQEIGANASGDLSFPVNKSVYENSKYIASIRTDNNDSIIGIDNEFMKAYIDIVDNVNTCTLYRDVSHSFYNDYVIGNIVDKYLNGDISKEKFIRQLTSATEIYLSE